MPRGRILIWAGVGSVVAVVAVVIAVTYVVADTSSNAASSPAHTPTGVGSQPSTSTPVVRPASGSSFTYLSDMKPSGDLGELVNQGPVTIAGSMYPKSISFYCNVGDPTAFPAYTLKRHARRFQATLGLPPGSSSKFRAIVMLLGGGRTLRTFTVSALKPKTVDVSVKGVRTLHLECFGAGNSYTGGEAIALGWGNARIAGGR
jgi:hypothetical protein